MEDGARPSANLLIDTVGATVLPAALRAVVPGGRAVLVGYTGGTSVSLDLPELMQRDVSLLPLNMLRREAAGRAVVDDLLSRLADGRLRLEVTSFALDDAARALEWIAQRGHRGRAVLVAPSSVFRRRLIQASTCSSSTSSGSAPLLSTTSWKSFSAEASKRAPSATRARSRAARMLIIPPCTRRPAPG